MAPAAGTEDPSQSSASKKRGRGAPTRSAPGDKEPASPSDLAAAAAAKAAAVVAAATTKAPAKSDKVNPPASKKAKSSTATAWDPWFRIDTVMKDGSISTGEAWRVDNVPFELGKHGQIDDLKEYLIKEKNKKLGQYEKDELALTHSTVNTSLRPGMALRDLAEAFITDSNPLIIVARGPDAPLAKPGAPPTVSATKDAASPVVSSAVASKDKSKRKDDKEVDETADVEVAVGQLPAGPSEDPDEDSDKIPRRCILRWAQKKNGTKMRLSAVGPNGVKHIPHVVRNRVRGRDGDGKRDNRVPCKLCGKNTMWVCLGCCNEVDPSGRQAVPLCNKGKNGEVSCFSKWHTSEVLDAPKPKIPAANKEKGRAGAGTKTAEEEAPAATATDDATSKTAKK